MLLLRQSERVWWIVAVLALLLVSTAGEEDVAVGSTEESTSCSALGFTGLSLCSDCDHLLEYVKDDGKLQHLQCCSSTTIASSVCIRVTYSYDSLDGIQFPVAVMRFRLISSVCSALRVCVTKWAFP